MVHLMEDDVNGVNFLYEVMGRGTIGCSNVSSGNSCIGSTPKGVYSYCVAVKTLG